MEGDLCFEERNLVRLSGAEQAKRVKSDARFSAVFIFRSVKCFRLFESTVANDEESRNVRKHIEC